jgi:alanine racemase
MSVPYDMTKLYIDVKAIKHNLEHIQAFVGEKVEVMPVIKGNAYGCGIDIIKESLIACNYIAVAGVKEALVAKNFFSGRILLMYQPSIYDVFLIIENNFIPCFCFYDFAEKLNSEAKKLKKKIDAHIAIDTGAGRLGVNYKHCCDFAQEVKQLTNINIQGLFTHYACANSDDKSDMDFTSLQTVRFCNAVSDFESIYGVVKYKHSCCSSAIITQNDAHFNMVRPGCITYGYCSNKKLIGAIDLKPSIRLVSTIMYIKKVEKGTTIGYNCTHITKRESVVATVSIGYSDGINVRLSNKGYFVLNNQLAPIIGEVCMNITMIDITDVEGEVNVGDEVSIFDNVNVTVDEISSICGTVNNAVISQISSGIARYAI